MDKAAKEKGERNFLKYWIFSSPLEKGTSFHSQKKNNNFKQETGK